MSESQVVTVKQLVKSYGGRRVVDGVDLEVGRGEIVGLIGANGADRPGLDQHRDRGPPVRRRGHGEDAHLLDR